MTIVEEQPGLRSEVIAAAARLLDEGGAAAVTTRRVAEAAGTQAPTIYRLFGDKDGLLDAVVEHAVATYATDKTARMTAAVAAQVDPVEELRDGWHSAIGFGVSRPALFALMSDPERARRSPATKLGREVLASRVHRVAATGRLRVPEDVALAMIQAAGTGTVLAILSAAEEDRDPGLAHAMLDAVLDAILLDRDAPGGRDRSDATMTSLAVGLRAAAPDLQALSPAERRLLTDWLDRVIAADR